MNLIIAVYFLTQALMALRTVDVPNVRYYTIYCCTTLGAIWHPNNPSRSHRADLEENNQEIDTRETA